MKNSCTGTNKAASFGNSLQKPSKELEFDEERFLSEMIRKKGVENQAM